jgi:hypothetical protein
MILPLVVGDWQLFGGWLYYASTAFVHVALDMSRSFPFVEVFGLSNEMLKGNLLSSQNSIDGVMISLVSNQGFTHYAHVKVYDDVYRYALRQRFAGVYGAETARFVSGTIFSEYGERVGYDHGVLRNTVDVVAQMILAMRIRDKCVSSIHAQPLNLESRIF